VNPRSEPLLWLQLMAIAAMPLELLALLLVLAGADPGPVPALERLLAWGLGALGPAVLLLRRPADIGSLLLVQVPVAGRSALQRRLASLQTAPLLSVLLVVGVAGLLPLLWQLDAIAALATPFSPLTEANRLVTLLLAMPLLAVLVWQWQQLLQALWLLSRSSAQVEAAKPLAADALTQSRLSLGLPLLLLQPLQPEPTSKPAQPPIKPSPAAAPTAEVASTPAEVPPATDTAETAVEASIEVLRSDRMGATSASPTSNSDAEPAGAPGSGGAVDTSGTVAVEPEQQAEEQQGTDLDQQIL
jgi:hypothetical protein